jgi:hypothetical protein
MTPPNWNHVDHELTRKVLVGALADAGSIEQAIEFANQCLQADQHNEDVAHETYHARANALEEAEVSFLEHDDIEEAVRELRRFWSV